MCGRFTQTASPEVITEQFQLQIPPLFKPRYNIAPSQSVLVIRITPEPSARACVMLRWGLIPSWAKDVKIGVPVHLKEFVAVWYSKSHEINEKRRVLRQTLNG